MAPILLLLAPLIGAVYPTPKQDDPVNDFAGVLEPADAARARAAAERARRERGVPIVIATIESLAAQGAGDWSIERYATNLYNEWGIGDRASNRGVLILVSVRDRKLRIATGVGLGNMDGPARQVIDGTMVPRLKAGDLSGGIAAGAEAVAGWFGAGAPVAELHPEGGGGKRMRWRFPGKVDGEYQKYRTAMVSRIDEWWKAFERDQGQIAASFKKGSDWDLPGWMAEHLQAIDERLMWEYGPGVNGGHRLVITPEADRFLRPLVSTILERAPKIPGWEFYPYRLAESVEKATAMLKARKLASIAATKVRVTRGEHHQIDLKYLSPEYAGPEDPEALNSVFVATEVILGEEMLDTWIGAIEVGRGGGKADGLVELKGMKEAVEAQIAAILKSLPDQPAGKLPKKTDWTLWELKPEKESDYPEQKDLYVGRSMFAAMWTAVHSGANFSSRRFSRSGELFCYVKIDGSADLSGEKFADKAAIEDALDGALKASGAGAVVGGGTGLRYSYVDLALTDPEKGLGQVVDVLRKGKIVKRAWILFFDDVYRAEWVGVWEDSPAPPGME